MPLFLIRCHRNGYRRIVVSLPKMLYAAFPANDSVLAQQFNYAMSMTTGHYPLLQLQLYGKYNQEEDHALSLTRAEEGVPYGTSGKPFIVAVVHGDYPFYYRELGIDSGIIPEFYREYELAIQGQVPGVFLYL